jgi:hypothetical protein
MSEELESVGALSTATLAAAAIEGAGGHGGKEGEAHGNCANCGAQVTGPFCRMCGQAAHIHRSLLHLIEEALHGIWHFDANVWRTLPLLVFSPGRLTRRYIDGQRKKYISPLALFLFMVFLTFFAASLSNNTPDVAKTGAEAVAAIQKEVADNAKELAEAKLAVAKAADALEAARKQGSDLNDLQENLDDARNDEKTADADFQRLTADAAKIVQAANDAKLVAGANAKSDATAGATAEQAIKEEEADWPTRLAEKFKGKRWMHSNVPAINDAIKHTLANPELAIYKLKNTTYKYSFMLVPISLPFLWLMFFWRRGVGMFDHAVFVLYSLCFMSLLFVATRLIAIAGFSSAAVLLFIFVPPVHMFVQLRGTYALGVLGALWRTCALTVIAAIVLLLFFMLVLVLSMH